MVHAKGVHTNRNSSQTSAPQSITNGLQFCCLWLEGFLVLSQHATHSYSDKLHKHHMSTQLSSELGGAVKQPDGYIGTDKAGMNVTSCDLCVCMQYNVNAYLVDIFFPAAILDTHSPNDSN